MNSYEMKQENRRERLLAAADRALKQIAEQAVKAA